MRISSDGCAIYPIYRMMIINFSNLVNYSREPSGYIDGLNYTFVAINKAVAGLQYQSLDRLHPSENPDNHI